MQFLFREKCSDLTRTIPKTYPIRTFHLQQQSRAVLFLSRKCFESSVPVVKTNPIRYTFCDAPFDYLASSKINEILGIKATLYLRWISCHGRNYSQPYFFKRNQSSDNRSHGFGAKFLLKKLSASDFSYERKSALKDPFYSNFQKQ